MEGSIGSLSRTVGEKGDIWSKGEGMMEGLKVKLANEQCQYLSDQVNFNMIQIYQL